MVLLLLLIYAVGGAIINVAVAWGFLYWESVLAPDQNIGTTRYSDAGMFMGLPMRALNQEWDARVVQFRPVWPGFAINTIFYAAILWLLFAALHPGGFVRRRLRARRGQCPACAYPVGSCEVCTECGRPLR